MEIENMTETPREPMPVPKIPRAPMTRQQKSVIGAISVTLLGAVLTVTNWPCSESATEQTQQVDFRSGVEHLTTLREEIEKAVDQRHAINEGFQNMTQDSKTVRLEVLPELERNVQRLLETVRTMREKLR